MTRHSKKVLLTKEPDTLKEMLRSYKIQRRRSQNPDAIALLDSAIARITFAIPHAHAQARQEQIR